MQGEVPSTCKGLKDSSKVVLGDLVATSLTYSPHPYLEPLCGARPY